MKKHLKYILIMLLVLPAAFSCDTFSYDQAGPKGDHSLIISGIVSDMDSTNPLEGIKISFSAYPLGHAGAKPLHELNVYTDNKGKYRIEAEGFSEELTCILNASDNDEKYENATQEINISWEGVSYDAESGTFVVNAEEFKLKKTR